VGKARGLGTGSCIRARTSPLAAPGVVLALSGRLFFLRVSLGMDRKSSPGSHLSWGESVAVLGDTGHTCLGKIILGGTGPAVAVQHLLIHC
jgi:hypothetical protein